MTNQPQTILDDLAFGEAPRWRDGALWFSDMHAHEVVRVTPDGTRTTTARFDGPISGLGWLRDGRMLVVSMTDQRILRQESKGFVIHGDLSGIATGLANDMVVDACGNAFVGNFGFSLHPPEQPRSAKLARVTSEGAVSVVAEDMMFPNGMVITPDGRTLVVGESFSRVLSAFDLDANGDLDNRRIWAALPDKALPDGICLDAEGAVWVASPSTSEVLRMREGGEILARVPTEQLAIACMLGGEDRRTLYILTAASTDPAVCRANRSARLMALRVGTPGAGRP